MAEPQLEIVRDYTTTRRVPVLVGRFRDGMRLPGGPYTLAQVAIFCVLLLLLNGLRPIWGASIPPLFQWVVVLGAAAGGAWATRSLPRTTRNVPGLVIGYFGALLAPTSGKIAGRPATPLRPRMAGETPKRAAAAARAALFAAQVDGPSLDRPEPQSQLQPPAPPAEIPAPPLASVAFTGVERLRALTRKDPS